MCPLQGGMVSIPSQGTKIPHVQCCSQRKKKYEVYGQEKGIMRGFWNLGSGGARDSPSPPPASGTSPRLLSSHLLCSPCTGSLSTCGFFTDPLLWPEGSCGHHGPAPAPPGCPSNPVELENSGKRQV